jgi:predicted DNA-binding protein
MLVDDDDPPDVAYDAAIRANGEVRERLAALLAALSHLTIAEIAQALEAILEEVL